MESVNTHPVKLPTLSLTRYPQSAGSFPVGERNATVREESLRLAVRPVLVRERRHAMEARLDHKPGSPDNSGTFEERSAFVQSLHARRPPKLKARAAERDFAQDATLSNGNHSSDEFAYGVMREQLEDYCPTAADEIYETVCLETTARRPTA